MKRILYISYFFPPLGGGGVQRALKFVRYLPSFGWQPTVLTAATSYWMEDPSLLAELNPETKVLRAPFRGVAGGGEKGGIRSHGRIRWLRGCARFFMVPDAYLAWTARARPMARRALRQERYDAILTTSSPDSAHLLGRRLKKETGLPWVADFRDPWTRRLSYHPPTPWHHAWHRRLEESCLRAADAVVVTTEETKEDFLRLYPKLPAGKMHVIANGYDEEDFLAAGEDLSAGEPSLEPVLHAGQLNPERPIEPYLQGLRLFLTRAPERADEVRTLFLGGYYDADLELVRRSGLESTVRFARGKPHRASIAALLQAKVLLLIEENSDRGRLILPGKIFEYLRAGKPILALVPVEGAAARLVRACDAGVVADPARVDAIAEAIDCLCGPGVRPPHAALPVEFERRRLTQRLAGLLDGLTPRI